MMDYEIFKEVVAEKMPSYLPGELKGRKVMIHPVEKINQTLDGLTLKLDGEKEKVSPTIYVNDMYEHYKETEDLQSTLENAGHAMLRAMAKGMQVQKGLDFDNLEEEIVFQLINTEQNKDMLAHVYQSSLVFSRDWRKCVIKWLRVSQIRLERSIRLTLLDLALGSQDRILQILSVLLQISRRWIIHRRKRNSQRQRQSKSLGKHIVSHARSSNYVWMT